MLPNADDLPPCMFQFTRNQTIPSLVGREFFLPEQAIVRRQVMVPWAAVPKASVNKDDYL